MISTSRTVVSAAASALALAAGLAAIASPASAATSVCRTTLSGGLVGNVVIASSHDVFAEAPERAQRVDIDKVVVNVHGQKRYRLAASVTLVNVHSPAQTSFVGGAGYYVAPERLKLDERFSTCVARKIKQ